MKEKNAARSALFANMRTVAFQAAKARCARGACFMKEFVEEWDMTKSERKEYRHQYYLKHKEKERLYSKSYYESHKGDAEYQVRQILAQKKWREANKEKYNGYMRKYYANRVLKKILAEREETII